MTYKRKIRIPHPEQMKKIENQNKENLEKRSPISGPSALS
jgi:hypothetical protein